MTLLVEKGTFQKTTSTSLPASQQVNLVNGSLTPKLLILWGTNTPSLTQIVGDTTLHYGFSDGTNSACQAITMSATNERETYIFRNDAIVAIVNNPGVNTVTSVGTVSAFAAGSFTLSWTVNNASAPYLHYIVVGGTDITNVQVVNTTTQDTSTGNHSWTGSGTSFTPDFALCMTGASTYTTTNTLAANLDRATISIGAAKSTTQQWVVSGREETAVTSDCDMYINNSACLTNHDNASGAIAYLADFVSFDEAAGGGITLNVTDGASSGSQPLAFLLVKGATWDCNTFQQRSGTGTQDVTITSGLDPSLVFLAGIGSATAGAVQQNFYYGLGASDGTREGCSWFGSTNGLGTHVTAKCDINTKVYRQATPAATPSSSTVNAECDMTGMATAGQFTLDWTTADTTLRQMAYWVVGPAGAGTTPVSQTNIHKYNMIGNTLQNSIQKYHILVNIAQTNIHKYNLLNSILQSSIHKYNLFANALQTSIHKYNLVANVLRTSIHKYDILNFTEASTSIHKYNLFKNILQTSIHKYNLLQDILQTSIHKYGMSGLIAALSIHKYHILNNIASTSVHKYNLLNNIAQTSIHKYHLLQNILQSSIHKYNLFVNVLQSSIQKYNLFQNILQSSIHKYNLIQYIVGNSIAKYNLLVNVLQTSIHKYDILSLAAVLATSIHKYHLFQNILQTNIHKYNLLVNVLQSSIHKYHLLQNILQTSIHKYYLLNIIAQTSVHKYNLLKNILQSSIHKYNLFANIAQSSIHKYNLLQNILQTSIHKYNLEVLGAVVNALIAKYNILQYITQPSTHKYNLLKNIAQTTIHKYNLLQDVLQSTVQKYDVLQNILLTSVQKYNILQNVIQLSIHKYDILAEILTVLANSIHKYDILQTIIETSKHKYGILNTVARTSIHKYNLLQQILRTSIHKYNMGGIISSQSRHLYRIAYEILSSTVAGGIAKKRVLKTIKYPVYHVEELRKFERRRRLRGTESVIIPAFKYNIHRTIAPFVIVHPISGRVEVRFAMKDSDEHRINFNGKAVPIQIGAKSHKKDANKAHSAHVMQQKTIEKYGNRLNKLTKIMTLFFLHEQLPDDKK